MTLRTTCIVVLLSAVAVTGAYRHVGPAPRLLVLGPPPPPEWTTNCLWTNQLILWCSALTNAAETDCSPLGNHGVVSNGVIGTTNFQGKTYWNFTNAPFIQYMAAASSLSNQGTIAVSFVPRIKGAGTKHVSASYNTNSSVEVVTRFTCSGGSTQLTTYADNKTGASQWDFYLTNAGLAWAKVDWVVSWTSNNARSHWWINDTYMGGITDLTVNVNDATIRTRIGTRKVAGNYGDFALRDYRHYSVPLTDDECTNALKANLGVASP